jgi:O2-independent ubiquinone biosynthesis accessory factor UbiT
MHLPRLPREISALGSLLPGYPPSAALSLALNLFAPHLFAADESSRLEGKTIRLQVRDAGLTLTLRIRRGGYAPCRSGTTADATVSADARDFVQLALGKADPDTLFFNRRLTIAGDTDIGLLVKNALDRITPPVPRRVLELLRKHVE